jgi:lysine-specific permease
VIISGGGSVPAYGFKNWNIPPGPIVNGFYGIITVYSTAFFAYGGTELIGITAGEAENPRQSVPKAINGTFWRITIFYVLSIFILGLMIPHNDPQLSLLNESHDGSLTPFTLAFEKAGISYMAHVMNAVILIAAISAANSCLYATSRTMSALASENKAPQIFSYTTSWGVPLNSLLLSTSFGLLSFLGASFGSNIVFVWLTNITGISSII